MAKQRIDVQINGGNGFYTFHMLTDRAREFVSDRVAVEAWQDSGSTAQFSCDDTRQAMEIADGMQADGLIVR